MSKPIVSVIVPCYNEQENIKFFYAEFLQSWTELSKKCDYELLFVDDGSEDHTIVELEKISKKDKSVRIIEFVRNFGKEIAVTAGLNNCKGDSAIIVDADLQYPIERIPEFVDMWLDGHKLVVGLRGKKKTSNLVEKIGSKVFNSIMKSYSEVKSNSNALDFRLLDREIIDQFNRFSEKDRIVRTLIDWLGYEPVHIEYEEKQRYMGKAKYSFKKRVKLAINSFTLHTLLPLKIIGYLGIFITTSAILVGLFAVIDRFYGIIGAGFSGSFVLGVLNTFLIGLVLISIGLVSLYIANIKNEVVNRPLYVVKNRD